MGCLASLWYGFHSFKMFQEHLEVSRFRDAAAMRFHNDFFHEVPEDCSQPQRWSSSGNARPLINAAAWSYFMTGWGQPPMAKRKEQPGQLESALKTSKDTIQSCHRICVVRKLPVNQVPVEPPSSFYDQPTNTTCLLLKVLTSVHQWLVSTKTGCRMMVGNNK